MQIIWNPDEEDVGSSGVAQVLDIPRISTIYLRNTGKVPIERADFQAQLELTVSEGEIVDAFVTDVSHKGVHSLGRLVEIDDTPKKRSLAPALMNPGDWLRLQVLTQASTTAPELTCWLKGQDRDIKRNDRLLQPSVPALIVKQLKEPSPQLSRLATSAGVTVAAAIVTALTAVLGK